MRRYESSIRIITAFFAALVGLAVRYVIDGNNPLSADLRWPCFLLSVFLFLRFLLGSANHLWYEYTKNEPAQVCRYSVGKDFGFLISFGCMAVAITFAKTLKEFLW